MCHHQDYKIFQKQMRAPGAVLSFELRGGFEQSVRFINKLKLCLRAVSLGTVDTLIRMSVGLEDLTDLLHDLEQALQH
ncbi:MAG: PLP-dependent transferase [Niabella sp.]